MLMLEFEKVGAAPTGSVRCPTMCKQVQAIVIITDFVVFKLYDEQTMTHPSIIQAPPARRGG